MRISFIISLSLILLPSISLFTESLWLNQNNFYKLNLNEGDIIKIIFNSKTVIKRKEEIKNTGYEDIKGRKGTGNLFNFYPDASSIKNDTIKNKNEFSLSTDFKSEMPLKIIRIDNNEVELEGNSSITIDNDIYNIRVKGFCSRRDIKQGRFIYSSDLYNSTIEMVSKKLISDTTDINDLIITTNFTEIYTNKNISDDGTTTNIIIQTNESKFSLKLEGLSDNKKFELIKNYLNQIIGQIYSK